MLEQGCPIGDAESQVMFVIGGLPELSDEVSSYASVQLEVYSNGEAVVYLCLLGRAGDSRIVDLGPWFSLDSRNRCLQANAFLGRLSNGVAG